nr:zinc finger, CCHC-type [Tanacetum cinerariifolium]
MDVFSKEKYAYEERLSRSNFDAEYRGVTDDIVETCWHRRSYALRKVCCSTHIEWGDVYRGSGNISKDMLVRITFVVVYHLFTRGAARYRQVKVLEFFDCLGSRQGVEDFKQRVKRMASMNTGLNIKKLDRNIVQKDGGSKQVRFKQLSPGVETRVHGVHDEKRVGFEVEMQRAQGDCEAEVVLYRNIGFNESGEYKKTFIGSGVGTGSMQVLHGFEFEVEPLGDHTFEVEPQENIDQGAGLQEAELKDDMDARSDVFYNEKLVQTLLEGRSILSLEGSLSGNCDVEKNGKWSCIYAVRSQEYQMLCTILGIAYANVGYGLMIMGCAGSLKANLQHMKVLSTTEAGYMTFTEA